MPQDSADVVLLATNMHGLGHHVRYGSLAANASFALGVSALPARSKHANND
jgi:hypothetical protein